MSIKNLSDGQHTQAINFKSSDISSDVSKGDFVIVNSDSGLSGFYLDDLESSPEVVNALTEDVSAICLSAPAVQYDKTTGETFTKGSKLFYNNSTNKVSSSSTGNILVGYALEAKASADTSIIGSFSGYVSGEVN